MKKVSEHVIRWRENHHKALESLRGSRCKLTGLQLWRRLTRIERKANLAAVAYCNGEIQMDEWEWSNQTAQQAVKALFQGLPTGFFVNGDPRGYALKIDPEKATIPEGMYKDWGGYGCLAAVIE